MASGGYMERDCPHDRISELPEMIRLHILSLLPRKDAIRTDTQGEFVEEISGYMQQYQNRRIEVFRLFFNPGDRFENTVKNWIQQAISCGVEEFHLNFSQGLTSCHIDGRLEYRRRRPELKERIFRGNQLAVLNLSYCRLYKRFRFEHFGFLEVLNLHGVNITDSMLERVVSNCPLLRKLDLSLCIMLQCLRVSGPLPRLNYLRVVNCWNVDVVEISAPNLEKFYYISRFPSVFLFYNISSLVHVILCSAAAEYWFRPNNWLEALVALEHVEVLTLCSRGIQHMFGPGTSASFALPNLRVLRLSMHQIDDNDIMNLYRFFKQCYFPYLEKLSIELPTTYEDSIIQYFFFDINLEDPPKLSFEHLQTISIDNFEGRFDHLVLLQFLLERAVSLDHAYLTLRQELNMYPNRQHMITTISELLKRSRAPATAQIFLLFPAQDGYGYCRFTNS
ncbi:putative F-box protein At1g49610 isoform X2 [Typha angustifolia]|uniref:putative F-box protein At1g49610 isoform X2 n=1 Tax=Typha angustifolia TaxID=59011 RepID=UPI003C2F6EBA